MNINKMTELSEEASRVEMTNKRKDQEVSSLEWNGNENQREKNGKRNQEVAIRSRLELLI